MLSTPSKELLAYYSTYGLMTDPGEHSHLFDALPDDISKLCDLVQKNLMHVFWAERYGRVLSENEKYTVNVRPVSQKLAIMQQNNLRDLVAGRDLDQRQIGNCRDFAVLLTSLFRHKGIPARARCGFGTYFLPEHYEDHWVCEYWNEDQQRWILVDAQLDQFQCNELNISFDPLDVPREHFVVAGQAWHKCRLGAADPTHFGISNMHGWWFIWGNVVRELLALNKIEILPWDYLPGCMTHELSDPVPSGAELAFHDGIASLTVAGDFAFQSLRALYDTDPRFQVTKEILG